MDFIPSFLFLLDIFFRLEHDYWAITLNWNFQIKRSIIKTATQQKKHVEFLLTWQKALFKNKSLSYQLKAPIQLLLYFIPIKATFLNNSLKRFIIF